MRTKIKEWHNKQSRDEYRQKRTNIDQQRSIRVECCRRLYKKYPLSEFSHFIICEASPIVCPMRYEDLQVDGRDTDRRHCPVCDKSVYKADNKYIYDKLQDRGERIAVSNALLSQLHTKIDDKDMHKMLYRVNISKLFLDYRHWRRYDYKRLLDDGLSHETIYNNIITYYYGYGEIMDMDTGHEVDTKFVLEHIVPSIDDEELQQEIKQNIKRQYTSAEDGK